MFEHAFQNMDNFLRVELLGPKKAGCSEWSGPSFREYLDGLEQGRAAEAGPLLAGLDQITAESDHAIRRYLFAAAASEIMASGRISTVPPRHFLQLTTVNPDIFLAELAGLADSDWEKSSRHTISVHRETRSIDLSVRLTGDAMQSMHSQDIQLSDDAERVPYLMNWLQKFSSVVGHGTLQLARIVRLEAGGRVYRHVDRGLYNLIRDRYHLVLQSRLGSRMQCETQTSIWYPGQAWWFNNHVTHRAFNDSEDERIHVIFDVLPRKNQILVPYLQQYAASFER